MNEKVKKEQIREAIIKASKDPMFLADIAEMEKDFEYADFEEGENG